MSLTFVLYNPRGSSLGQLNADWFLSVLQLDRQRDGRDLWEILSPLGPFLLDQHLSDSGRKRQGEQKMSTGMAQVLYLYRINAAATTRLRDVYILGERALLMFLNVLSQQGSSPQIKWQPSPTHASVIIHLLQKITDCPISKTFKCCIICGHGEVRRSLALVPSSGASFQGQN